MFYVLRMAEPQFFVVFRQIKHRQEVGFYIVHCAIIAIKICVENFFQFCGGCAEPRLPRDCIKIWSHFQQFKVIDLKKDIHETETCVY